IASVWHGRIISESTLSTRITAARSAIGDNGGEQRLIKTLPRKGVRFVGTVREEQKPPEIVAGGTLGEPEHKTRMARPAEIAAEQSKLTFASGDNPSIAVLPFTNISGDPEHEYFADGMAEEIITALSRCKWLLVLP